jgi:hypothetical protein
VPFSFSSEFSSPLFSGSHRMIDFAFLAVWMCLKRIWMDMRSSYSVQDGWHSSFFSLLLLIPFFGSPLFLIHPFFSSSKFNGLEKFSLWSFGIAPEWSSMFRTIVDV